jgi:glycerophosphoryl diester phosphodiesterase
MKYPEWLAQLFYLISDGLAACIPRSTPTMLQLQQAKVMAHRGIYDNKQVKENTLMAFQSALKAHVWAIEMDIRWTKDLQPVVHHDSSTARVFIQSAKISDLTLAELQQQFPEIPSLKQVANLFAKKIKLVLELKQEHYDELETRKANLQAALQGLEPGEDFYLISLEPKLLDAMNCFPSKTYFPIGKVNMQAMNDLALHKNYGGIMGHYVFTKTHIVNQHRHNNKLVCTGFVDSKNCLFRELRRGVNIISTNKAEQMQKIINKYQEQN